MLVGSDDPIGLEDLIVGSLHNPMSKNLILHWYINYVTWTSPFIFTANIRCLIVQQII